MVIFTIYISQVSVVTQLRCIKVFSNCLTANFPQNAAVKEFWKLINIQQRYRHKLDAYFFGPSSICYLRSAV